LALFRLGLGLLLGALTVYFLGVEQSRMAVLCAAGALVMLALGILSLRSKPGEAEIPLRQPPSAAAPAAPATPSAASAPICPISFEALQARHMRPGLALYRPYPPVDLSLMRSHMGGLPSLPPGIAWPRAESEGGCMPAGTPLHFLAQIDLAEQPWLPDHFPASGTLLFFGMLPAEDGYYWSTANDSRVMFDPDSNGVPAEPPEDLLPPDKAYDFHKVFGEEAWPGSCTYPHWPLHGKRIETMPDPGALSEVELGSGGYEGYNRPLRDFRAEQAATALGLDLAELAAHEPPTLDVLRADPAFPFVTRFVGLWARGVRHLHPDITPDLRDLAGQWLAWADSHRPGDPVRGEAAREFAALFDQWPWPEKGWYNANSLFQKVINQLVCESGGDQRLAANLPREFYEAALEDHAMVWPQRWGSKRADGTIDWEVRHHQLGGHVPSTQSPAELDGNRICLMQMRTDYGADMMLCDVGECDFWIKPADLARADFSDVEGDTRGG
jgi:hypothetical protein